MNHMKAQKSILALAAVMVMSMSSCSEETQKQDEPKIPTPEAPDTRGEEKPEILSIKIGANIEVVETPFDTRSGNSRDLIGVEITRKTSGSEWNAGVPTSVIYASGVFDDIEDIVFKFVKGGTYLIKMCYYPNAKDIVYNYPNGTYGAPFSEIYGLQEYTLNEPVYYDGLEGGWGGGGNQGPRLLYLLEDTYQPTSDRYVQSFRRGDTPRYSGMTDYFTVNDNTGITVNLELCMMSITLQPDNFTEGILSMCFRSYTYMEGKTAFWDVKPGDDMTIKLQTPYNPGEESLEMFYTNGKGEKYLLATKQLQRKHRTNFVFKFALVERADGSIGIQVPSDETFGDEDSSFDF